MRFQGASLTLSSNTVVKSNPGMNMVSPASRCKLSSRTANMYTLMENKPCSYTALSLLFMRQRRYSIGDDPCMPHPDGCTKPMCKALSGFDARCSVAGPPQHHSREAARAHAWLSQPILKQERWQKLQQSSGLSSDCVVSHSHAHSEPTAL